MIEADSEIHNSSGNLVDSINHMFNVTTFCAARLNEKMTLSVPGPVNKKFRDFRFNFDYLFNLSSANGEIDKDLKKMVRYYLDMIAVYEQEGNLDKKYIKAGLELFSQYSNELHKNGMIDYKKV